MNEPKVRHVGLLLFGYNTQRNLVAILQKRGEVDVVKGKRQLYPGICQVTVHGKVEEGESFRKALARETVEEIGNVAAGPILMEYIKNDPSCGAKLLYTEGDAVREVRTYGMVVSFNVIASIRWHHASGGLRILYKHELPSIQDVSDRPEWYCVPGVTYMFPDEKRASEIGFEVLQGLTEVC